MSFFRKVTDAEGNETFEEVDFSEADLSIIPDDAFYKDTRYKTVSDSDVKRRKKLKELETELEKLQTPTEEEEETPVKPVEGMTAAQVREEAARLLEEREAEMTQRIIGAIGEREKERTSNQIRIDNLLAKHNLPQSLRSVVATNPDPEATAEALARESLKFAGSSGGNSQDNILERLKNVNKNLGLE